MQALGFALLVATYLRQVAAAADDGVGALHCVQWQQLTQPPPLRPLQLELFSQLAQQVVTGGVRLPLPLPPHLL